MPRFTQHEVLDLQEHARTSAATAQCCRQFAQIATDPDLRSFCEQEANNASQTVQRLISLFQQGQAH